MVVRRSPTCRRRRRPAPPRTREHDPREHVGDRRRTQREPPDARLRHAAILEDARHHRERGDRHRRGHEQRERPEADARRRERIQHTARSPGPRAIGSSTPSTPTSPAALTCARTPSGARSSAPTMNMKSTRPSVDSDDSAGSESFANSCAWRSGAQRAEHDRPEHEARRHLADHRRLAEVLQQQPARARGREDDHELQQQRANGSRGERLGRLRRVRNAWTCARTTCRRGSGIGGPSSRYAASSASRPWSSMSGCVARASSSISAGEPAHAHDVRAHARVERASSSGSLSARFISWNQSMLALVEEARDRAPAARCCARPIRAASACIDEVQLAALHERIAQAAEQRDRRSAACAKNSGASSAQ